MVSADGNVILAVNGEIYNHMALRRELGPDVKFKTHSDCEVIIPLVSSSAAHPTFMASLTSRNPVQKVLFRPR